MRIPASFRCRFHSPGWSEHGHTWLAAITSALLQTLMLVLLFVSSRWMVPVPDDNSAGERLRLQFVARASEAPSQKRPGLHADTPTPASKPQRTATTGAKLAPKRRSNTPAPLPLPEDRWLQQASTPAAESTTAAQRDPLLWNGQPPGIAADGPGSSLDLRWADKIDAPVQGAEMEADGYVLHYNLRNDLMGQRWSEQGMTEIYYPLPGTDECMVCPLPCVLKRKFCRCRRIPPGSAELAALGDARLIGNVVQVSRGNRRVWIGPGAYR